MQVRRLSAHSMKKMRWRARPRKKLLELSTEQQTTLREWIAKTWQAIGVLRKNRGYKTTEKCWDPCLAAQRNFVAWCYRHKAPISWDNFVYYFGLSHLFWEHPSLPEGLTIAALELQTAEGTDPRGYSGLIREKKKKKKDDFESFEDSWEVILTISSKEKRLLKKKLTIRAKSWPSALDHKPAGPRWSIQFNNQPRFWSTPCYTSSTVIQLSGSGIGNTDDDYQAWWKPVLVTLCPDVKLNQEFVVQVQPRTYRARHEIHGLFGRSVYDE